MRNNCNCGCGCNGYCNGNGNGYVNGAFAGAANGFTAAGCGCVRPNRKYLEPVLVARIYNQPIVEEIPYSAMSVTLDNTSTISNVSSDSRPICEGSSFEADINGCGCGC